MPFLAFPEPRGTTDTFGRDPSPSDAVAAAGPFLLLVPSFVVAGLAEPPGDALVPSVAVAVVIIGFVVGVQVEVAVVAVVVAGGSRKS